MKNYYVMSNGRVKRENNTLVIEQQATGQRRPIPVEDVDNLYIFGEVDVNSKLLNFLAQKRIPLHLFNYYGHYSGTFHPREYLHSGYLVVQQAAHYADMSKRMALARETVQASAHSILRTLAYYVRRKGGAKADDSEPVGEVTVPNAAMDGANAEKAQLELEAQDEAVDTLLHANVSEDTQVDVITGDVSAAERSPENPSITPDLDQSLAGIFHAISILASSIAAAPNVDVLRGLEGKMRERYYAAWRHILIGDWSLERRVRRPPDNELNALISFGNSWLYTVCVSELYRTQLLPTIAYLHEPGERRFSLALDLSELFKPLIVDRVIFRLINNRQVEASHFDKSLDGCLLTDAGRQLFLRELESKLATTIRHRRLGRHVSYRHLIRLECYKLVRHLTDTEKYHAFRAWW